MYQKYVINPKIEYIYDKQCNIRKTEGNKQTDDINKRGITQHARKSFENRKEEDIGNKYQ